MYCGIATRENKIKWCVFGCFLTLGFVFFFVYLAVFGGCYQAYGYQGYIKYDNSQECAARYGFLMWFAVISWIFCSIPLYMMCCCTNKPNLLHTAWAELEMEGQEYTPVSQSRPSYMPPSLLDVDQNS